MPVLTIRVYEDGRPEERVPGVDVELLEVVDDGPGSSSPPTLRERKVTDEFGVARFALPGEAAAPTTLLVRIAPRGWTPLSNSAPPIPSIADWGGASDWPACAAVTVGGERNGDERGSRPLNSVWFAVGPPGAVPASRPVPRPEPSATLTEPPPAPQPEPSATLTEPPPALEPELPHAAPWRDEYRWPFDEPPFDQPSAADFDDGLIDTTARVVSSRRTNDRRRLVAGVVAGVLVLALGGGVAVAVLQSSTGGPPETATSPTIAPLEISVPPTPTAPAVTVAPPTTPVLAAGVTKATGSFAALGGGCSSLATTFQRPFVLTLTGAALSMFQPDLRDTVIGTLAADGTFDLRNPQEHYHGTFSGSTGKGLFQFTDARSRCVETYSVTFTLTGH